MGKATPTNQREATAPRGVLPDLSYGLNETYAAECFVSRFGEDLRYDHERKRWFVYRAPIWIPDPDGHVRRCAMENARGLHDDALTLPPGEARKKLLSFAKFCLSDTGLNKVINIASCLTPVAIRGGSWDPDLWLLAARNGVLDLKTGRLRRGRRDDLLTLIAGVDYDTRAECPRWELFLLEVFDGDAELVRYVQRCVGYVLTGLLTEQVWWLLYGAGVNGKSTFLNVLRFVLGTYAATIPFKAVTLPERDLPDDVATLPGKRFVFASEAIEEARLNEARIKAFTGSDPVTARHLYGRWFTFVPHLKLFLSCNHLPEVRDASEGFRRRVRAIPFTGNFTTRPDKRLEQKLRQEGPGILRWSVLGLRHYRRSGLETPPAVLEASRAYARTFDLIARFVADCCAIDSDLRCGATEAYRGFEIWAARNGMPVWSQKEFGTEFGQRFPRKHGNKHDSYRGVGLK